MPLSLVGHISEERKRKAPSLFNRAVSEPLTTVDQGRVKPGNVCSVSNEETLKYRGVRACPFAFHGV